MSDDWLSGDPTVDSEDPAAVAREQRRREREERRREREAGGDGAGWAGQRRGSGAGREPAPEDHGSPPTPRGAGNAASARRPRREALAALRRNPYRAGAALAAIALALAAVAALAVRYFDREPPPPVEFKTTTLTVPEGLSRAQVARLARREGLRGSYLRASVRSPHLKPARYGGAKAKSLEGFLFPDTFELRAGAPVADLVRRQLEDFKRRIRGVDMRYARSKNLTVYDVVTIASMVEEEAMLDRERRLIAAVVYNRLRDGIPLGIDATIRFASGNYTRPLTESELADDSPYNTRLNAGLPPGPIGNPGLASIEAAAHPARVDYLYYVVEPGTCGEHSFSSTDAEFQRDVARYNSAREAAGGRSPDSCG
jgi:cell division protein YceG involved in septum cleavage